MKKRYQRADVHPLWDLIETFNGHFADKSVDTWTKPFTNDFIYVHNAYKAFLSTLLSHYNDIKSTYVLDALKKIEDYNKTKNGCSSLESVLNKRLDYFNKVIYEDEDYIKVHTHKEYFLQMVSQIFENQFNHLEDEGLTMSFYEKLKRIA